MRSFDVFLDLHPNERLSNQWWGWWFETPSWPLWRHVNVCRSAELLGCSCHSGISTQMLARRWAGRYVPEWLDSKLYLLFFLYLTKSQNIICKIPTQIQFSWKFELKVRHELFICGSHIWNVALKCIPTWGNSFVLPVEMWQSVFIFRIYMMACLAPKGVANMGKCIERHFSLRMALTEGVNVLTLFGTDLVIDLYKHTCLWAAICYSSICFLYHNFYFTLKIKSDQLPVSYMCCFDVQKYLIYQYQTGKRYMLWYCFKY